MDVSDDFDYCELMAWESPSPIRWVVGNTKWHAVETDVSGRLEFNVPSCRSDADVERLLAFRLSESLPLTSEKIVYKPNAYELVREYRGKRRRAVLLFPPDRQGAVLSVKNDFSLPARSQLLLYSRFPDNASVNYPEFDSAGRIFTIEKCGFRLKVAFEFADLREWTCENAWQATRAGYQVDGDYQVFFAFGRGEEEASRELEALRSGGSRWEGVTKEWWNDYFRSCPIVSLKDGVSFENELFLEDVPVDGVEFVKRQLWHYYSALASIIDVPWRAATPVQVAERFVFNKIYTNDNSFGVLALSLTNQSRYVRSHLVNFITHLIRDDGQMVWCARTSGERASFPPCNGVPAIAHALGHYVRCVGDVSILEEDVGGVTVWEKIKRYENDLLPRRDVNQDGLIEWNHIWETGEDNKVSPFFRKKGLLDWIDFYAEHQELDVCDARFYRENVCPVTAINEQVFHLWSLREMAYLADVLGEDPEPYRRETKRIIQTISKRHWDSGSCFYYDYDVRGEGLFRSKNLDSLYFLYFERDQNRVAKQLKRLNNTGEFNLALLPSLARDDVHFDPESYWAGAAWPREQGFVALGLKKRGCDQLAFDLMLKTFMAESGPVISETVNPLSWPPRSHGSISSMAMASCNLPILLDICGLNNWEGPLRRGETELPISFIGPYARRHHR